MSPIVDWIQTGFNVVYLTIAWIFLVVMVTRYKHLNAPRRRTAFWILLMVAALALGDSVHLIPRIYRSFAATAVDATSATIAQWIGFGLFASSFTLSFFYLFLQVYCWRKFNLAWAGWMWFLLICFTLRVGILFFPQNNWVGVSTTWKFYRNIPFVAQGIGVIVLLLRYAGTQKAAASRQLQSAAYAIIVSFVCYAATLIGTLWNPIWGALMLPKTIAYLVVIAQFYKVEFQKA